MHTQASTKLRVKPVEYDEELRLASSLLADRHADTLAPASEWFRSNGRVCAENDRAHTRIAVLNGEVAGALRVTNETLRLGEARLKAGGIGWVAVSPRFARQGVEHALLRNTHDYLRESGYHVAVLFKKNEFLRSLGYAPALEESVFEVETPEPAVAINKNVRVRDAKPGDIPALQRVHTLGHARLTCSLLRSRAHVANKWEFFKSARVLADDRGKVVAYFRARSRSDHLEVDEAGFESAAFGADLYAAIADAARRHYLGRIRFLLPAGDRFLSSIAAIASARRLDREDGSAGMLAFVNVAEALESAIPEWESLVARHELRSERSEVTLVIGAEQYRIRSNRGAIDVALGAGPGRFSVAPSTLVQLLTGYRSFTDVVYRERRILSSHARSFLAAIFPRRNPYVPPFDRF